MGSKHCVALDSRTQVRDLYPGPHGSHTMANEMAHIGLELMAHVERMNLTSRMKGASNTSCKETVLETEVQTVSSLSLASLKQKRYNNPDVLPLISEPVRLRTYLTREIHRLPE